MAEKEKVLELIQKCLNLGKSPNEYEAAAAMAKASELLERYNLSLADIRREETTATDQTKMVKITVPVGNSEWKRDLLNLIATQYFCRTVISGKNLHFLGREVNVYAALTVGAWIVPQLENIAFFESHTYDGPIPKLRYRNSILFGAISIIRQRMREERDERVAHSSNLNALIVNLFAETTSYLHKQFPRLGKHYGSQTSLSGEGYARGRTVGGTIDLHGSRHQVNGGPKALPSGR